MQSHRFGEWEKIGGVKEGTMCLDRDTFFGLDMDTGGRPGWDDRTSTYREKSVEVDIWLLLEMPFHSQGVFKATFNRSDNIIYIHSVVNSN